MDQALENNHNGYPVYLMFQDEARFGRLSDPKRCWCPAPFRPKILANLVRQFNYVFGAVCPTTGHLDYMRAENMRTPHMSQFLRQVSRAHSNKFVIMVLDGASTHKSKDLVIPANVSLIILPPYSPELNPSERIWNQLRKKYMGNRYFNSLDEAMEQVDMGLSEMERNRPAFKSLTNWDGIRANWDAT